MKIDEIMQSKIEEIVKSMVKIFFNNLENDDILSSLNIETLAKYIVLSSSSIVSSLIGTYVQNVAKEGHEAEAYYDLLNIVIEKISLKDFIYIKPVEEH